MRNFLDRWWQNASTLRAGAPMQAHFALRDLYESLDDPQRKLADRVLAEWLSAADTQKQWDAWATIFVFQIKTALPELRGYYESLVAIGTVPALGHAEDVKRSIDELSAA